MEMCGEILKNLQLEASLLFGVKEYICMFSDIILGY